MTSNSLVLTGLDGANPLGYFAALGVLRTLDHRARNTAATAKSRQQLPRLSWLQDGCWRPVIHQVSDVNNLVAALHEDVASWGDDPAFLLAYDDGGETLLDPRSGDSCTRDLKPKPAAMREYLERLAQGASAKRNDAERRQLHRSLDTAAALASEVIQDNKGNTKPTTFHFTAGQQQFMKAVAELQEAVTEDDFREALLGPWLRESPLPNMSWDATNARSYALRARNPSGDKKTTVAGADWLGFVGIGLFPVTPRGKKLVTTGVVGGWKDSVFTWPVWEPPATYREVRALLRTPRLATLDLSARASRGIAAVFAADIGRSDQGGYGSFSPAAVM